MRVLNKDLQRKAENELNEKPDRIEEDIQHIKDWIEKEPHLTARTDDQWILSFLRGCKFSLQRTKEKIDYYYTMRSLIPELFTNRDPFLPEMQTMLKNGVLLPLPKTGDADSSRILLFKWDGCEPDVATFVNISKLYFMIMDFLINEDDNCMVAGKTIVGDYKCFNNSYILQFTPGVLKKYFLCLQNAYPIRIKGLYICNSPSIFETVFNMIKSFLSEKLKERVFLFSEQNIEKLHKQVPQSLLPKEYGGDNGSVDELAAEWKKKIESYKNWFAEDAKYCTNEKLRYGQPHTEASVFGVEGTFRKLVID